jgi:hypothetical protein
MTVHTVWMTWRRRDTAAPMARTGLCAIRFVGQIGAGALFGKRIYRPVLDLTQNNPAIALVEVVG